jgi:Ca2+-binding EF-hand superfamily protein
MGLTDVAGVTIPQDRTVVELLDDRVESDEWTDSHAQCDCIRRLAEVILTSDETESIRQRFLDAREPVAGAMDYEDMRSVYRPIAQLFEDEYVRFQKYTPQFIRVLEDIEQTEDLDAVYEEVAKNSPLE